MRPNSRLTRAASDTCTIAPVLDNSNKQSADVRKRRSSLAPAMHKSKQKSELSINRPVKNRTVNVDQSSQPSRYANDHFRRPWLSPMDRLFIFFFDPSTRGTDAWTEIPSPQSTTSPSSPLSPSQRVSFFQASSFDKAFTAWLPSIGFMLLMLVALTLRLLMMPHPYSGEHQPPMFGDYEAQRHWMELTVNLPVHDWYRYDLQYWGLDYPPFTAYVSWFFGKIAQYVEPGLVALDSSRGYETPSSRMYMRLTVVFCDVLIFLPALFAFTRNYYARTKTLTAQCLMVFVLFMHPAFILIDHGHFQYNCVCLGLTVWALIAMLNDRPIIASVTFCLSLGFKQMTLYYAPVFFVYLLIHAYLNAAESKSSRKRSVSGHSSQSISQHAHDTPMVVQQPSIGKFFINLSQLAVTVIGTFAILCLPWLLQSDPIGEIGQILFRMFPVARGLYEDKVANFWCATSILIKWPQIMQKAQLVTLSLSLTLTAFLPSVTHLLFFPSPRNCMYSMAITSLSFFLFSFQVHEKTILLPLLPVVLMFADHPLFVSWFSFIATFTMFPLLDREGLSIAYTSSQLFFCAIFSGLIGSIPLRAEKREVLVTDDENNLVPVSESSQFIALNDPNRMHETLCPFPVVSTRLNFLSRYKPASLNHLYPYVSFLTVMSLVGAIVIHFIALLLPFFWPNCPLLVRYPDLLSYMFVIYGFVHFMGFFIFLYWLQLTSVGIEKPVIKSAGHID